jgi:hypothetical protein
MDPYERCRLECETRHKRRANRNLALLKALTSSKDVIDAFEALDVHGQAFIKLDDDALATIRDLLFKAVEKANTTDKHVPRAQDTFQDKMCAIVTERFGPHTSMVGLISAMYETKTTTVERMEIGDDDSEVTLTATEDLHLSFQVMFVLGSHGFKFNLCATLGLHRGEDGTVTYTHKKAIATEDLVRHEVIGIRALEQLYRDVLLTIEVPPDVIAALKYTWKREY